MLFQHSFQYILQFSTHLEIFNIILNLHYSFQHTLKCSTCCFNIVFNTYYSFQYALEFSRCFSTHLEIFNIVLNLHYSFQHALKLSTNFFNMRYSFQNMLKCSTCFFTVFRICWKFQHAFLQFSDHAENFNMLFYSFQHSFSICFQNVLQISTHSEIFKTLSNMKIWNIYSQIVTEPFQKYLENPSKNTIQMSNYSLH